MDDNPYFESQYRAVFYYPGWLSDPGGCYGYGPPRDSREEAEQDHPRSPEETHGVRVGVQHRYVSDWVRIR